MQNPVGIFEEKARELFASEASALIDAAADQVAGMKKYESDFVLQVSELYSRGDGFGLHMIGNMARELGLFLDRTKPEKHTAPELTLTVEEPVSGKRQLRIVCSLMMS